jgi:hypothetical protein
MAETTGYIKLLLTKYFLVTIWLFLSGRALQCTVQSGPAIRTSIQLFTGLAIFVACLDYSGLCHLPPLCVQKK